MSQRRSRFVPGLSFATEALESRLVLSAVGAAGTAAEVAGQAARRAPTKTSMTVTAGTIGQPLTFDVTVRAAAAAGSPTGSVEILDHGKEVTTLDLTPTSSSNTKSAYSTVTAILSQQTGGSAYYFGKHHFTAVYVPSGAFAASRTNGTFTVPEPTYTTLTGGVQVATVLPGSGPQIQAGQTASVLYTGFLQKNGQIFDDSVSHGGAPFSFQVGAGQVVPGFDTGTVGMQVGETRAIVIPAAEGYGAQATGSIPANSNLVFLVTLESIS